MIIKDINDHSPSFDLPFYSTRVIESADIGRQVIRVTATDKDIGSNAEVRYALVNNSAADYFTINSVTGGTQLQYSLRIYYKNKNIL